MLVIDSLAIKQNHFISLEDLDQELNITEK